MNILWVATKSPWPPVDGGRLLVWETLGALAGAGHAVSLIAPARKREISAAAAALAARCRPRLVVRRRRLAPLDFVQARLRREPFTIARHRRPEVAAEVERRLSSEPCDVAVAEQLQALPQLEPARRRGLPVVLRQQNVESDLWAGAGFLAEAGRLAAWEGRALREGAAAVIALTERDARRLRELAGAGARVVRVPAPFPAELPAASHRLPGTPAVVVLGSSGWAPNRDQVRWFVREIWPAVRRAAPGAVLHVFGEERLEGEGVIWHGPPADSRAAFAPGSVFAVPLRLGSGVRMKILEAWARGIPVVATPQAAAGLDAEDVRELVLARDAAEFADAIRRLAPAEELRGRVVAGGRALLRARHDPARVAAALEQVLRAATQR